MINCGGTYREAYALYKQSKIPKNIIDNICAAVTYDIPLVLPVTEDFLEGLLAYGNADVKFTDFLGGSFFICETLADLKMVQACDFEWSKTHPNQWPSIVDTECVYDLCDFLPGEPRYLAVCTIWNDAGGTVYFIPATMMIDVPTIEASLRATKAFWEGEVPNRIHNPLEKKE